MAIILDMNPSPGVVVSLDVPDDEAFDMADRYAQNNGAKRSHVLVIISSDALETERSKPKKTTIVPTP